MDDLISRQVLLAEQFASLECILQANKDAGFDVYKRGWNDALQTVYDNAPSEQQWIPCSERLPDDGETVLVTRDDGTCKIATFEVGEIENGWQMDSWYTEDNVTAWMPLPDCYQGDGKGEGD